MFKHSEDEVRFTGMLKTYRQEFGEDNLVLLVPYACAGSLPKDIIGKTPVQFWKRYRYGIRTLPPFNAEWDLIPKE